MSKTGTQSAKWISCPAFDCGKNAKVIDFSSATDVRSIQFEPLRDRGGMPMFRRTFSGAGVSSARVTATALGIYELFCNGSRIGTEMVDGTVVYDELKPGWTDYHKRVLSDTYDLTPYLTEGENVLLAVTASGWYTGRISYGEYGNKTIAFSATIELMGENGVQTIPTDESWETIMGGPVRAADIWDGEYFDARVPGYATISRYGCDPDDAKWQAAVPVTNEGVAVVPRIGPQIRIREGLEQPVAKTVVYDGVVFNGSDFGKIHVVKSRDGFAKYNLLRGQTLQLDFGQELVGWPRLVCNGAAGTRVDIRFGEFLNDSGLLSRGNDNPEGALYTVNYRTAKAKASYVLRGNGSETYLPMFTFFGFRYLEIKADADVVIEDLRAVVVGSDIREIGSLKTSDALVNRLIQNIIWGQRSNYLSVPTDCPQRDERLGWTGDTQIFCRTAAYNADVRSFFKKWLGDCRDSQTEDGAYPDVVPRLRIVGTGSAAWGDVGIVVPYDMYLMYNDLELLGEHYASMEKYMAFVHEHNGPRPAYNDWVCFEEIDRNIIPLAYYGMDAKMMVTMSRALSKTARARYYESEFSRAKSLFRDAFVKEGRLVPTSQCGYLIALKAGFLEGNEIALAVQTLKEKIVNNGYRLSTGFVGTGVLNQTLSEFGEDGLAYSLLLQENCPSWLYSVKQGATTMWERWNSYTLADGFGPVGMNSFNHYAYGAVGEWMYRFMCGIDTDPDMPGFGHVLLSPRPDLREDCEIPEGQKRITSAAGSFESVHGVITSAWEMKDGVLTYSCTVPVGATLTLPMMGRNAYVLNGERRNYTGKNGKLVMELQPGSYKFVI